MKFISYSILVLSLLLAACQPQTNNSANEAFKKNSETVKAYLKGFEAENVDYSVFAADFIARGTSFGSKDTVSLAEMMESDKGLWAAFDFKLLDGDSVNLLPGVDPATKLPDGSVRYYGDWQVTLPATDSTEAKTGILKLYESFDFNAEGKIIFQQVYGDFTGIMMHLSSN